jgi:hypothetical protein
MAEKYGNVFGNLFSVAFGSSYPVGGDGPLGVIKVPMTAAAFLAATGRTPTHAYTCQEPSGNLIDQIGSLTLIAAGTPLYQQSISGWIRKGVGFNEGLNQRFSVTTGSGPDPAVTPVAMLVYFRARTPAATRSLVMISDAGGGARVCGLITPGGLAETLCGAAAANDGVVDYRDTNVHAMLLAYDAGNTTVSRYTDQEKDNGTFGAGTIDAIKGIGALAGGNSHLGEVVAFWIFDGADARYTDAQAKSLLQGLGWSIAWS